MAVKDVVDTTIDSNTITVFSKSWCPYCKAAKKLLQESYGDKKTEVVELDEREDGDEIQSYLQEKTGQRTVPNIFVNKQHVGGNDAVQAAHKNGKLKELLAV
ncbi:glutaredoxin [Dendrothele bispora CBS 962.96]|uniref:glutathione peroxidase n=1 Tax=Dendrothele bispora (strain CBS 962.96) TaxID=1314807 RepID=A0A4S8KT64_DENBC|nr:glutaredoxin [Dendrothele bispora CBS 962.96]THU95082.1 glutaredoxin [Dendrothele bispora CBS 962.96]